MINRSTTKEAAVLGKGSLATLHGHQTAWAATENWSFLRAQNINNRHCMMLPFFAVVVSLLRLAAAFAFAIAASVPASFAASAAAVAASQCPNS